MNCCCVGSILGDNSCPKTTYSRKVELNDFEILLEEEQDLVLWRAELKDKADSIKSICLHHKHLFLGSAFTKKFTKCCNIFGNHSKKVKGFVSI